MEMVKQNTKKPSSRSDLLPVNRKMLHVVRDELKSDILAVRHEMKSFSHRVDSLDHKIESLDHKVESLSHKVDGFQASVSSQLHEMKLMWESNLHEQRLMMEHMTVLFERQDRVEQGLADLRRDWEDLRK